MWEDCIRNNHIAKPRSSINKLWRQWWWWRKVQTFFGWLEHPWPLFEGSIYKVFGGVHNWDLLATKTLTLSVDHQRGLESVNLLVSSLVSWILNLASCCRFAHIYICVERDNFSQFILLGEVSRDLTWKEKSSILIT